MNIPGDLITKLANARSICVLTGAGISAESGVPTFRGTDGLWSKFKPEELANIDSFLRNPGLVWEWYAYRRKVIRDVSPNAGHRALVELQNMKQDFTLVTQNVDGLHQRAGSCDVLELHGNIERSFCIRCRATYAADHPAFEAEIPHCPACDGLLRPDVVWFGEVLPLQTFQQAEWAAENADVFLSIGTSGIVYPAASLPLTARASGASVVEINTEPTDLSHVAAFRIPGKAGEVLPHLVQTLRTTLQESS